MSWCDLCFLVEFLDELSVVFDDGCEVGVDCVFEFFVVGEVLVAVSLGEVFVAGFGVLVGGGEHACFALHFGVFVVGVEDVFDVFVAFLLFNAGCGVDEAGVVDDLVVVVSLFECFEDGGLDECGGGGVFKGHLVNLRDGFF